MQTSTCSEQIYFFLISNLLPITARYLQFYQISTSISVTPGLAKFRGSLQGSRESRAPPAAPLSTSYAFLSIYSILHLPANPSCEIQWESDSKCNRWKFTQCSWRSTFAQCCLSYKSPFPNIYATRVSNPAKLPFFYPQQNKLRHELAGTTLLPEVTFLRKYKVTAVTWSPAPEMMSSLFLKMLKGNFASQSIKSPHSSSLSLRREAPKVKFPLFQVLSMQ